MGRLEELKKKYEELGKEIERLEKHARWRAKLREVYYFVDKDTETIRRSSEDNHEVDEFRYKTRNYFKTKEEAKKYLDNINTYYELMDLAEELNAGEIVDWENQNQLKYYIILDVDINKLCQITNYSYKNLRQIYCLNNNFLEIALEKFGKKKLKQFFREDF